MNPRKQRFYIAAAAVLALVALAWSLLGSPVVLWHNHQLKSALTGLTDTTITLEQAVPFSWDEVYTVCALYPGGGDPAGDRRPELQPAGGTERGDACSWSFWTRAQ